MGASGGGGKREGRASRPTVATLERQIVCLSGASGAARTNKWKQIISWPHYANESGRGGDSGCPRAAVTRRTSAVNLCRH